MIGSIALFGFLGFVQLSVALPALDGRGEVSGSIRGRITIAATGEPVRGLVVEFLGRHYTEEGILVTQGIARSTTDEQGNYGAILPASARYYIHTTASTASGDVFLPLFYPGTPDETTAAGLDLLPGREIRNADFAVSRGKPVAIRGRLIDGLGRRLPHLDWVWMSSRVFNMSESPTRKTQFRNSGPFELTGVLPGSYYLHAYRLDDVEHRAETVTRVEVGSVDLENVEVMSAESHDVSGRIRFDGPRLPLNGQPFKLSLSAIDDSEVVIVNRAQLRPDGSFEFLPFPTGRFRLSITGVPPPYFVRSARVGEVDVLNNGLALGGAVSYFLDIVLAADGEQVNGIVVGGDEKPIRGTSAVALLPAFHPVLRPDLYKIVNSDSDGRFSIAGIAPGDYELYAWESLQPGAHFDPAFMNRFADLGKPVRIVPGGRANVVLKRLDR